MLKSILVHLDDSDSCDIRLGIARSIAKHTDGKVFGLHYSQATAAMTDKNGEFCSVETSQDIRNSGNDIINRKINGERESIHRRMSSISNFSSDVDWKSVSAKNSRLLIEICSYHDLVVMSSSQRYNSFLNSLEVEISTIVSESGKPVFVVPENYKITKPISDPLIVWQPGRATARAISHAVPILAKASNVTIIKLAGHSKSNEGKESFQAMKDYLRAHGVNFSVITQKPDITNLEEELVGRVQCGEHDLAVLGTYDHTKVSEIILNAIDRVLLKKSVIPLLLSH